MKQSYYTSGKMHRTNSMLPLTRKMLNNGINISLEIAGKEKLAINSLSKTVCDATVQVLVENASKEIIRSTSAALKPFPKQQPSC